MTDTLPRPPRLPRWAWAVLGAVATILGGLLIAVGGDFDSDGLSGFTEWRMGSDPLDGDYDDDGLRDGDEVRFGTRFWQADTDRDGVLDGIEVAAGMDPLDKDTDGDGIPDRDEPVEDCDGDGIPAFATSDDDGDGLPDHAEAPYTCDPDRDDDGVLDGHEGNLVCILLPDCDGDGLIDGLEVELDYDPLDADTFDSGLTDAVTYAFASAGRPPSADQDHDGIPDGWEDDPDFDWGPFRPVPGETDVLVEYVRVVGPDSGRFAWLDFTPAYDAVAQMFLNGSGMHVRWVETVVEMDEEHRPDFLTPEDFGYYRDVLNQTHGAADPYVTSVVLNPQQVQQHVGSILGAAFLRSMIATVDYGAHTVFHFEADDGARVAVRQIIESHLQSGNPDLVNAYGFDDGGLRPDGQVFLREDFDASIGTGYTITWRPEWFRTAPLYTADNDATLQLELADVDLRTAELATTIAHELGHTLGLCHTHVTQCFQQYPGIRLQDVDQSTMSYTSGPTTLHFLGPEWQRAAGYLGCAPQTTVALVAQNASHDERVLAKYAPSFIGIDTGRQCIGQTVIARDLAPVPAQTVPFEPYDLRPFREDADTWMGRYMVAVVVAALLVAALIYVKKPEPPTE